MNSVVNLLCRGARLHHHGCDIQNFSSQLQTTVRINTQAAKSSPTQDILTLQTTLIPSMSSADRVLICDVPFRNCSDSDIPE